MDRLKIQKQLHDITHKARPLFVMALLGAFVCCMCGCGGGGTIKKSITNTYNGSTATTAGGCEANGGQGDITAFETTIPLRVFMWLNPRASINPMFDMHFVGIGVCG